MRLLWIVVSLNGNQSRLTNFHHHRILKLIWITIATQHACSRRPTVLSVTDSLADIMQRPYGCIFSFSRGPTQQTRTKEESQHSFSWEIPSKELHRGYLLTLEDSRCVDDSHPLRDARGIVGHPNISWVCMLGTRIPADSVRDVIRNPCPILQHTMLNDSYLPRWVSRQDIVWGLPDIVDKLVQL